MGCDSRTDHRAVLSEDTGSGIIEGLAAIGLAFLIMVVLVQAAMLTIARSAADAATSQAARRVSVLGTSPAEAEDALIEMLLATVPGAVAADTEVAVSSDGVTASARTRWVPPGPDLFDLWITTTSTATAVSPP